MISSVRRIAALISGRVYSGFLRTGGEGATDGGVEAVFGLTTEGGRVGVQVGSS